jgi:archaellum component FlaC
MSQERLDELNEELTNLEIERDACVDVGDTERVHEIDMELETIKADIRRLEMELEKSGV